MYIHNSQIAKKIIKLNKSKKSNENRFQLKTGPNRDRIDNIKLEFLYLSQKRT